MRIIRQRRRLSVHKIKRRRRWSVADASTAASGRGDSAACRCWPVMMADPVYNLLLLLVIIAAIVSIFFYTTLTILPRAILVMGLLACIWGALEGIWGQDQLENF